MFNNFVLLLVWELKTTTVVGDYINTIKTTLDFNFYLNQTV